MMNWFNEVLPFIANVAAVCATVGLNTLFKAASSKGLSYYVFMLYEYAINAILLLPIAFFFGRKVKLPSSKFSLFWRICLLGVLCVLANIVGLKGIEFSSPTMASAANNLSPAFTFILAIIFRMEKLSLRSSSFQAKTIGTMVSISGALMVVLYKGPTVLSMSSSKPLTSLLWSLESSPSNWVIGGFLLIMQCLLFALWFIFLTDTMKMYPAELVVSFFHCFCVTIINIPICLIAETDTSAWKSNTITAFVAFIFSGVFGPAFLTVIHSWSLHLKGPVYVAIFNPFSIAIAVLMGVVFLGDALYLGSVIGAVILCIGVYAVIWGRAREEKALSESRCSSLETDGRIPFLQSEEVRIS